jgi:hypothetical protein
MNRLLGRKQKSIRRVLRRRIQSVLRIRRRTIQGRVDPINDDAKGFLVQRLAQRCQFVFRLDLCPSLDNYLSSSFDGGAEHCLCEFLYWYSKKVANLFYLWGGCDTGLIGSVSSEGDVSNMKNCCDSSENVVLFLQRESNYSQSGLIVVDVSWQSRGGGSFVSTNFENIPLR